jgi:hypothetical protein
LENVFNKNLFIQNNAEIIERKLEFKLNDNVDLNLEDKNKNILVKIEVKTGDNLKLARDEDLVRCYDNKHSKAHHCVNQLYHYLSEKKIKHGILTTFNQTWFFNLRLSENNLQISPTINNDQFLTAVYFFISKYVLNSSS